MRREADTQATDAKDQWHRERRPSGGRQHDAGPPQMIAQCGEVDAHERNAQQQKNRLGDVWFQHLAERRQRDADQHQRGDGAGALTAKPRQGLHRNGGDPLQADGHVTFELREA